MEMKVVLEIDKKLMKGEVLIFDGKKLRSKEVHELLPDLTEAKKTIAQQGQEIAELKQTVANLAKTIKEM